MCSKNTWLYILSNPLSFQTEGRRVEYFKTEVCTQWRHLLPHASWRPSSLVIPLMFTSQGSTQIVAIKKLIFLFLFSLFWVVNLVQSFRFRAAITLFFDITAFLYQNQNTVNQMVDGRQFCVSLNLVCTWLFDQGSWRNPTHKLTRSVSTRDFLNTCLSGQRAECS